MADTDSVLHGVSAFVRRHGSGRDVVAVIHIAAKVDGLCHRVVMVGQLSFDLCDFHIINAIVVKHLFRNLGACQPSVCRNFGITVEFAFQRSLHGIARNGYGNK